MATTEWEYQTALKDGTVKVSIQKAQIWMTTRSMFWVSLEGYSHPRKCSPFSHCNARLRSDFLSGEGGLFGWYSSEEKAVEALLCKTLRQVRIDAGRLATSRKDFQQIQVASRKYLSRDKQRKLFRSEKERIKKEKAQMGA